MPKVLRILNRFNLGGPVYNASYLSADLAPEFETLLVGGLPEADEISATYIAENMGIQVLCIPEMKRSINLKADRLAYQKLREIIRAFQPDIVHTHASKAGALGRLAAIKENVPVIVHTFHGHVFHSYFGKTKTFVFKSLERYLAKKSSAVVTISKQQCFELVREHKIIPASRAHIIPLGFDLSRFQTNREERRAAFRKQFNLESETVAIGIVGRFALVKNHLLFIDALALLKSKNVVAFFIGDGEERARIQTALEVNHISFAPKESYTNEKVCMMSWVTEVEVILPGLDIVALTSHNEGTPVSLIEAQAAGVPVVSTQVGGVQDVVLNDKTGFLVPPNDPASFAQALSQLIDSKSLRAQFAEEGVQHAFQHFTRDRLSQDIRALYASLI